MIPPGLCLVCCKVARCVVKVGWLGYENTVMFVCVSWAFIISDIAAPVQDDPTWALSSVLQGGQVCS